MKKFSVEKDGWHVEINNGHAGWVESNPTYTTVCSRCKGTGRYHMSSEECPACQERERNDPDWGVGFGGGCGHSHEINCSCRKGFTRDAPKHPVPSVVILDKLSYELAATMKDFGLRLDAGIIEKEIAEEKSKEDSLKGACL